MSWFLTRRHYLQETSSPAELGLQFEKIEFKASDGGRLRGWFIPSNGSDRAVILLHGHAGSMDPDLRNVPHLHSAGLNVLMFDFRAHGRSEGNLCTFGFQERLDVEGAVNYLKEYGMRRIALLGFSLGGMVAILAGATIPEVDVVIDDGAPARLRSAVKVWGLEHNLPASVSNFAAYAAILGASLRLGINLFDWEPVRWIGRIPPKPLLVIHGENDQYCPDFDELEQAVRGKAEVWRIPNMGHVQACIEIPEDYYRRVTAFLNANL